MQVAVPGVPDVTAVVPHPVFALHATFPVTRFGFLLLAFAPPRTRPFSPLIVAVNVTDAPKIDGLPLVLTLVLEVAELMVKLFDCELAELL